jgi:serine/threonine protein kinase
MSPGLFGKVKLVYNKRTGEHYALKCVSKTKVVRMQEEEHLRNEKLLMSELEHPFIAKLIRTFKDKDNVRSANPTTPFLAS